MPALPRLVEHIESHLGTINRAWNDDDSGPDRIWVTQHENCPRDGTSTYVTLGLSQHVLPMNEERFIRQELITCADKQVQPESVAAFLQTFAEAVMIRHRALLRGNVVGPSEPVVPTVSLNSVYAALPVLFDREFWTFKGSSPPTVFVWALPIFEEEAQFVKERGWEPFEDLLEAADPDLCDWARGSVVTPR